MIWWCLLAFIGTGFAHSVADTTVRSLANFLAMTAGQTAPAAISRATTAHDSSTVTVGNTFAGVVVMGAAHWDVNESYTLDLPSTNPQAGTFSSADDD